MSARRIAAGLAAAAAVCGLAAGLVAAARSLAATAPRFADADDAALTARGAHLYARQCASCHGRWMEGQALWQLLDQYRGRRAPALDYTGRSWTRPDDELFRIVKSGRVPDSPIVGKSHMPAFGGRLDDDAIVAVLAYVKANWPLGLRALQAARNPGERGMPPDALAADWRFPPTCLSPEDAVARVLR